MPHHTPPAVAKTDLFFKLSHIPNRGIVSVFRRIARTRLGDRIGISKDHTYPVEKLHQYFKGAHVSSCRGVLHTPTPKPQRGRKRDIFSKDNTYPVGELHWYFEGSHVSDSRGVSHTPRQTPPTVAYTDPFFEPSHVPGWGIASVFRRIVHIRL